MAQEFTDVEYIAGTASKATALFNVFGLWHNDDTNRPTDGDLNPYKTLIKTWSLTRMGSGIRSV